MRRIRILGVISVHACPKAPEPGAVALFYRTAYQGHMTTPRFLWIPGKGLLCPPKFRGLITYEDDRIYIEELPWVDGLEPYPREHKNEVIFGAPDEFEAQLLSGESWVHLKATPLTGPEKEKLLKDDADRIAAALDF